MSAAPTRTCEQLGVCQAHAQPCPNCKPIRFAPGVITAYERKPLQQVIRWVARQLGGRA